MPRGFIESSRRCDVMFRSKYPYYQTRLFQITEHDFELFLINPVDDFAALAEEFHSKIRFITVPVKLVQKLPEQYQAEISVIQDSELSLDFAGLPLTLAEIAQHVEAKHSDIVLTEISDSFRPSKVFVQLAGNVRPKRIQNVQETIERFGGFYDVEVVDGGSAKELPALKSSQSDNPSEIDVFTLTPSSHYKGLGCGFLERDEQLWFSKVDDIYSGKFVKNDLFFIDCSKTSCIVNFSKFENVNLRNHLLLYDVVYIVLPLLEGMSNFFNTQKITRDELVALVAKGRVVILNMQPEQRLDYGYINEIYQESPNGVVSRRALSALLAMDLVEINKSYIFSDPELERLGQGLIGEISSLNKIHPKMLSDFLFWPKAALRSSIDTLNFSGPMRVASFGINKPIVNSLPEDKRREAMEFEFVINSDQIHIANALDATYFPFFINNNKYTDQPFAQIMGGALNFYKRLDPNLMLDVFNIDKYRNQSNLSLDLISIFEVNDFNSISDFEAEVSSSVVRSGLNSLFFELATLNELERKELIEVYNKHVEYELGIKRQQSHALDLTENTVGLFVPFLGTAKRYSKSLFKSFKDKYPTIQAASEYLEDKCSPENQHENRVSLLTKVNRVAKLKRNFG
ncbi:hypothetical protein GKA54_13370 [Vibrio parahaemolyticus]|uniref:hypothetical protein n=1 Tax=Vibrio parahaemolyticus TaxID=670 RepID=UPI00061AD8A8|nr:hypothetical protein [Vibrio parahaemolyticus]EGQ8335875.1 hypothetical protein [Vibrio parahaemolyticus]EGQ8368553.1 hypothetical protein [Vibrio parahaemolyticus]EGQ8723117.1 hypothetical protein [Vibrio parahaemolyticus]EGQ8761569.1 hypothetical protein [Vibrio parahaemolyticus]EGQ8792155.1 hypothetical protein [Vibrio parahaemolyticus]